jgi:hypothetical protein
MRAINEYYSFDIDLLISREGIQLKKVDRTYMRLLVMSCSNTISYIDYDYTCFLSSPFSILIIFIVSQMLINTPTGQ